MSAGRRTLSALGIITGLVFVTAAVPVALRSNLANGMPEAEPQDDDSVVWVSATDASCGARTPCFATIAEAIATSVPGSIVRLLPGTYRERLLLDNRRDLVVERDPESAPDSVILDGSEVDSKSLAGIEIRRSENIRVRGIVIVGMRGPAILLRSGGRANKSVTLEQLRLFGNCLSSSCLGAVDVGDGNADVGIFNNLIHGNLTAGIRIRGNRGSFLFVIENTIHANGRDGIDLSGRREALLVNNSITGNGAARSRPIGLGIRVRGLAANRQSRLTIQHNVLCGNLKGSLTRPASHPGLTGNVSPDGTEGAGFAPSPGCDQPALLYADPDGPDLTPNSLDDDFSPAADSPLIDAGVDLLALPVTDSSVARADYLGAEARPADGDASASEEFDIGAIESRQDDRTPPALVLASPADGETVTTATPTIRVDYADDQSGIDLSSYQLFLDSVDVTPSTLLFPDYAIYTVLNPLSAGPHTLRALVSDRAGNHAVAEGTFTISIFRAIADCAPRTGTAPLQVTFRTRAEFSGGSIVRYRWDFQGDGTFDSNDAVARDFTQTFNRSGTFDAVLEVLNNLGETATDVCRITVEGSAPTATANATPSNGPLPLLVNFICTGTDPDGSIVRYEWDLDGDGVYDSSSMTTGAASFTYNTLGVYTARCRVTDNDGRTAEARTTTTVIRPGPPGSPSVEAFASPGSGSAPLLVNLSGTATDDGPIVLWEWDFEGDGTFDYSSATSPATSFTYANAGIFAATLRVTDDAGLVGIDTVEVVVNINATLAIPDDTFAPGADETAVVRTTLSGGVQARVFLLDRDGAPVRTLFEGFRLAGTYEDVWDGLTDQGSPLPEAPYYAILEYMVGGETRRVDLTNSTGGTRYNPARNTLPGPYPFIFKPFEDAPLRITFTIPSSQGASEVQAFIGLFNVDTRFITLLDRVPFGVGTHTIYWDGLDSAGVFAVPPPGDSFLFGIFGFTLPNNAIFLEAAPQLLNARIAPNFFDPSTPSFLTPTEPIATITYDLSKVSTIEFTATNLATGLVLRHIVQANVPAGDDRIVTWNGRADSGLFVDRGDYRIGLRAVDSTGSASLTRYALMRVFY